MYKPLVAVVGRPNVGKSTLFNAVVKKRISIVEDIPGVTRDRIYFDAEWLGQEFTMIDTGGIEFVDQDNHFFTSMRYQAELAIREADVIIYVVDGKTGIQPQDEEIAHILRSCGKPVILAVNKIDSVEQEINIYEFYNLGLGDPIGISAVNLMNLGDLLDEVLKYIKKVPVDEESEDAIHVALVGRPNVGKSSLTNALLGQDRVIVSNIPGTTRDSIDTHWTYNGNEFILIDTAGMRRKGKIDDTYKFITFGGDGGTYDIGFQSLSGAMERGHDLTYVCYDNEAYMNTGIQRSSSTPRFAKATTSPVGTVIPGKTQNKKNLTDIIAAHNVPYVAQTTFIGNFRDLYTKAKKAIYTPGPSFLNVMSPCPRGWEYPTEKLPEICKLAVETCVWPLFEVIDGVWHLSYEPKQKRPVEEYLRMQGRFRHMFKPGNEWMIEAVQQNVDENWEKLLNRCNQ